MDITKCDLSYICTFDSLYAKIVKDIDYKCSWLNGYETLIMTDSKEDRNFERFKSDNPDYINLMIDDCDDKLNRLIAAGENCEHYKRLLECKHAKKAAFTDLKYACLYYLKSDSDILARWQSKFKRVIVDEFNDIDDTQFEFITLLFQPHRNLFVVGDVDQDLFEWRGSNVNLMLNFRKYFEDANEIFLKTNYRSTENIINVANALIKNNKKRVPVKMEAYKGKGEPVVYNEFESDIEEADFIAENVSSLIERGVKPEDIAVLVRFGKQRYELERALCGNANKIVLDTIHSVKGLEFEYVFAAGISTGYLPSVYDNSDTNYEAERRLLYEAITRAKTQLYISSFLTCVSKPNNYYRQNGTQVESHFPEMVLSESMFIPEIIGYLECHRKIGDYLDNFTVEKAIQADMLILFEKYCYFPTNSIAFFIGMKSGKYVFDVKNRGEILLDKASVSRLIRKVKN